jgi:3-oxoacyl-[acyl-carrier-protein] synthase-3
MPLRRIAFALPSIRETAREISAATGAEESFVRDKIGVSERYLLGPGETGIKLAAAACRSLLERQGLAAETISVLVFVTQTPDRRLPQNSAGLAHELGLPVSVAAFDIALGCSGYVYGLSITEAFLKTLGFGHALLVTCDPYSRIMAREDKATNALFGDAATASLISISGSGGRIARTDYGTDGGAADAIQIPGGGARLPLVSVGQGGVATLDRADLHLRMSGRDVYNFVLSRIPGSIERCLQMNGLTVADIDHFALHQGSLFMLKALCGEAGIPLERVLINMEHYGNTVSSSVPLLLEPLIESGEVRGKKILVSGFGVGLSWATSVLRF